MAAIYAIGLALFSLQLAVAYPISSRSSVRGSYAVDALFEREIQGRQIRPSARDFHLTERASNTSSSGSGLTPTNEIIIAVAIPLGILAFVILGLLSYYNLTCGDYIGGLRKRSSAKEPTEKRPTLHRAPTGPTVLEPPAMMVATGPSPSPKMAVKAGRKVTIRQHARDYDYPASIRSTGSGENPVSVPQNTPEPEISDTADEEPQYSVISTPVKSRQKVQNRVEPVSRRNSKRQSIQRKRSSGLPNIRRISGVGHGAGRISTGAHDLWKKSHPLLTRSGSSRRRSAFSIRMSRDMSAMTIPEHPAEGSPLKVPNLSRMSFASSRREYLRTRGQSPFFAGSGRAKIHEPDTPGVREVPRGPSVRSMKAEMRNSTMTSLATREPIQEETPRRTKPSQRSIYGNNADRGAVPPRTSSRQFGSIDANVITRAESKSSVTKSRDAKRSGRYSPFPEIKPQQTRESRAPSMASFASTSLPRISSKGTLIEYSEADQPHIETGAVGRIYGEARPVLYPKRGKSGRKKEELHVRLARRRNYS